MGPADVLLICGLMGVGVYWLLYDFGVPTLLAVSVGCLTAYLPFMGLNTYAERRVRKLEIQLSEALDLMVSALRAGVPVRQTMELVRAEKKPPIRNEFHELISLIQLGVPPSQAFKQWAQPLGSKTLDSFAIAMATKWDVGGNYADMLLSMAERIRESIRLRRRVETLTAEAKLTTFLAILLPYGIAYIMSRMNPGHFSVLWDDPGARSILFLALLIQVGAIFWIRRMIRSVS
jgi:tight adherence protein B